MKILSFVDLHGSKKAYDLLVERSDKSDFIVCAGDFTVFEHDIKKWMKKISQLGKRVFLVHGNHENETVTKKLCEEYNNIEFMHGKIREFQELAIIGWGGGGFDQRDDEFEAWTKAQGPLLKSLAHKKKLLIVHAPFYDTQLDALGEGHYGNKSFRKFVKEYDIDVGVCGHFHENAEKQDFIRHCRVYNPGPAGRIILM